MKMQDWQESFIAKCRGRDSKVDLGISKKRLAVYGNLVMDKVEASITNAYPIASSVIGEVKWKKIITDFIRDYDMNTPFFWRMPEGFCRFAKEAKLAKTLNIPHLYDLLEFEWVEIEVYMMKDVVKPPLLRHGNVLEDLLYLNPHHKFSEFAYPVFKKNPKKKGKYHLMTYRHPETDQVHFLQLSAFYRVVLEFLSQAPFTGIEVISHVGDLFGLEKNSDFFFNSSVFLQNLLQLGVMEGFINEQTS